MNDLLVIKYLGNHNISGNINNLYQRHNNNSGVRPTNILDEEDSQTILEYLRNYDCQNKNLIIHINAHGFEEGICKELLDGEELNLGDLQTLITWEDLIDACNEVAARCSSLTLNLGAVCNSNSIADIDRAKNFDILVTSRSVSDTVKPQKINRMIFENTNLLLDNEYSFIPQQ
ncbi:hypothetical protein [Flavobacterium piscisymbiosum]|uniref:Uncharacterized protein n=1 Tax=Flavobacterium piscisymbiosum TaxID=2893753 RepID=A0ABS8MG89_9FLAO|nr:hypothetical protein [Flavobacterium sp. F-30]MCC9063710.1 hypothetical protein [Flavobacterium sp. F-30]